MALGAITGVLGAAQGIGGLFGGGGPRQPRMNRAEKQHLKSQANLNNAMAKLMNKMSQMVGGCKKSMFGKPCGCPQGPMTHGGMNGSFHGGMNMGFSNGMNNMFNPGMNFGNQFGGGFNSFGQPPQMGASFNLGISMHV